MRQEQTGYEQAGFPPADRSGSPASLGSVIKTLPVSQAACFLSLIIAKKFMYRLDNLIDLTSPIQRL
jgi:hypothetical protein